MKLFVFFIYACGLLTAAFYATWLIMACIAMSRLEARWRRRCEAVRYRMQSEWEEEERLKQFDLLEFIER